MTDYGTEYEVKCSETWAWYQGFVTDYNESNCRVRVRYGNDWKQPEEMDIGLVRPKYSQTNDAWRPRLDEEVECKARAEENEPYGWWTCKVSAFSGTDSDGEEQYMVSFIGWGDQHNETLGRSFIRQKSRAQCLSSRNMMKKRYAVPGELDEWVEEHCRSGSILSKLMPHRNIASQIVHIYYAQQTAYLVLVGVRKVLEAMEKIIHCFFQKQQILLEMEKKAVRMEQDAASRRAMERSAMKQTFNIHPLLSGYLRGKQNQNLLMVKRGDGGPGHHHKGQVLRVDPMATSCYVAATTAAALHWAIDHLQIVCKKVMIPNDEMGQIIGFKGQLIQDIKARSNVIKVISWSKWEKEFETLQKIQRQRYRGYENGYGGNRDEEGADGAAPDAMPEHLRECSMDSIFGADDTVDLTSGFVSEYAPTEYEPVECDHLVIIGRKSRVDLCIFMIEMALDSFRAITRARKSAWRLRDEINRLKGNQPGSPRTRGSARGSGRRGRMRGGRGPRGGRMGGGGGGGGGRSDRDRGDRSYNDRDRGDRDGARMRSDRSYNDRSRGGGGGRGDERDRGRDRRRNRNQQGPNEEEKDTSPPMDAGPSPRNRRRRERTQRGGAGGGADRGDRGGDRSGDRGGGRRGAQYRRKQPGDFANGNAEHVDRENVNGAKKEEADGPPVDRSQRQKKRRRRGRDKKQENVDVAAAGPETAE